MRALTLILLGCIPLTALTISTFVELGEITAPTAAGEGVKDIAHFRASVDDLAESAAADRPAADALADVDLLADASVPALAGVKDASVWKASENAWDRWVAARRLVAEFVEIELLEKETGSDDLNGVLRRFESLKKECEASSVNDREELAGLLAKRIATLTDEIARRRQLAEAETLLDRARAALVPQRYAECVAFCDQLLASQYAGVLEPSVVDKVRVLKRRAQFWADAEELSESLPADDSDASLDARVTQIQEFLRKYRDRAYRTPSELRAIDQYRDALDQVNAELATRRKEREAAAHLRQLDENPPAGLEKRLAAAASLYERYPTTNVKASLARMVVGWLEEFLPPKQVDEHPMFREAETNSGQIARGYFKTVSDAGGQVIGYKRYPTYEQLLHPVAEVGTFRIQDLRKEPGPTVPQACAARYNEARSRLLSNPGDRAGWQKFADLCGSLQEELTAYSKKPGSEVPESFGFAVESRCVSRLLSSDVWNSLVKIIGP